MIDLDIVNKILAIPLPIHDQEDDMIWGPTSNGIFLIKFAIWLHYDNVNSHGHQPL